MSALSIAPLYPFAGVVPVGQTLRGSEDAAHVMVEFSPEPTATAKCGGCSRPAPSIHRYRLREVRDLDLAHASVTLSIPHRIVRCKRCGIRAEAHDFLAPYRRATKRFERAVGDLCQRLPVQHVAEHFGLPWNTVKEIDKRRLQEEVGTPSYDDLRLLAVDEIAVHKGHRYMTSVLNVETGAIVWMGDGREKATLHRFFAELTPKQRGRIEAIATDMFGAYREAIAEAVPHVRLVFDLFHVAAKYSREVIDPVRFEESRKMETEEGRRLVKGSRFLLLRNEENLNEDQQSRLRSLLAANETLTTVYILKDQLKRIWDYRRPGWARQALHQWCDLAEASGIRRLQTFARNLGKLEAGIVAHALYPLHTGQLEGMHNRMKVIKRQAYGFRDNDYFVLKVKAAFHPNR